MRADLHNTMLKIYWLPTIKAATELNRQFISGSDRS